MRARTWGRERSWWAPPPRRARPRRARARPSIGPASFRGARASSPRRKIAGGGSPAARSTTPPSRSPAACRTAACFPTEAFRQVLNRVVREEGDVLLQYYPARGYPPLRQYLARYLLRFGVEATPDEILIVNGSQQGFDLVARTFLDPGDFAAVEQPTYPRALQVFRAAGAQLLAVPWTREGPRPDVLERLLDRHRPKLFYCQPNCHNPTGLSLTPETGRRLLAAAARGEMPIVEDGFDPSLYYGRRPATPLKALDGDGLVILRGLGVEIRVYGLDPDDAEQAARSLGHVVLAGAVDKPHGLRECHLVAPAGYVFVPSLASGCRIRPLRICNIRRQGKLILTTAG